MFGVPSIVVVVSFTGASIPDGSCDLFVSCMSLGESTGDIRQSYAVFDTHSMNPVHCTEHQGLAHGLITAIALDACKLTRVTCLFYLLQPSVMPPAGDCLPEHEKQQHMCPTQIHPKTVSVLCR